MGCSSYVTAPDPSNPTATVNLQFKYGLLREIQYKMGEKIYWEKSEVPEGVEITSDAVVPAWTVMEKGGDRHFALTVIGNHLSSLVEITEAESDRMYDDEIEVFDGRHAWVKS